MEIFYFTMKRYICAARQQYGSELAPRAICLIRAMEDAMKANDGYAFIKAKDALDIIDQQAKLSHREKMDKAYREEFKRAEERRRITDFYRWRVMPEMKRWHKQEAKK
jgi:hypothetical protein